MLIYIYAFAMLLIFYLFVRIKMLYSLWNVLLFFLMAITYYLFRLFLVMSFYYVAFALVFHCLSFNNALFVLQIFTLLFMCL